jgi:ubiquinone/menaquinone biosynthesis C-methylase UbiE
LSVSQVLDIGCGTGHLKDLLQGNFEYTGIDIAEKMLHYASQRGYTAIHQSIEEALPKISDGSYDYVFALGCLLFVEDIDCVLKHLNRIARQSILLGLDHLTQDYIDNAQLAVYNHADVTIAGCQADYFIRGWTSLTTGITIQTRMIYIPKG